MGAIVRGLGAAVLPGAAGLVELAGFVVEAGAEAQELHADQAGPGYRHVLMAASP